MGLTFFTLPTNYSLQLHEELFFLIMGSSGGFTFSDVYNLPLHIRRLYVGNLMKIKKAEQEQISKANSRASSKVRR